MDNIKDYNSTLISFVVINIIIILGDQFVKIVTTLSNSTTGFIDKKFIMTAIFPILTYMINGIVPSNMKSQIVFGKLKNPLPGSRVFSKLIKDDDRVSSNLINEKYGEIDMNPSNQNVLWYQIYSRNKSNPIVYNSHKRYLKFRDLTCISFCLLITTLLFNIFHLNNNILTLIYLISQFLVLIVVARISGNRFACNVIVVDINQSKVNG